MGNRIRRAVGVVGTAGLVGVALMASAQPADAGRAISLHGVFSETAVGATAGYDIHGAAKMTIGATGTVVTVRVAGLDPAKAYGSHLHNGTCALGGGGHYQDDVLGDVVPPNELWLTNSGTKLVPNAGGVAHGSGSATWAARIDSALTNARSVIVHEPGTGARIACVDLG